MMIEQKITRHQNKVGLQGVYAFYDFSNPSDAFEGSNMKIGNDCYFHGRKP